MNHQNLGLRQCWKLFRATLRLKTSTAGCLTVPIRILTRNNMTRDHVLCKNWYLLEEEQNSSHAKKDLGTY